MDLLFTPPTGELVTQADLHANTTLLRGEISEVRGEIAELRGELKADIGNLCRWGAAIVAANAIAVVTAIVA